MTNDNFNALVDSLLITFDPRSSPSYVNVSDEMSVRLYQRNSGGVNYNLRNGVAMSEENRKIVSDLITLSKPLEESQVLYRGIDLDLNEIMTKGAGSITFDAFASCSRDPKVALSFSRSGGVLMEIDARSNARGMTLYNLDGSEQEDETILAMGQELHIDSVDVVNIQVRRGLDILRFI